MINLCLLFLERLFLTLFSDKQYKVKPIQMFLGENYTLIWDLKSKECIHNRLFWDYILDYNLLITSFLNSQILIRNPNSIFDFHICHP